MKRFILTGLIALLAGAGGAEAKDVKIGLSWDARESALNQAWEDFMKAEAKTQGAAAGINVEWVVNMANNDSSRQAANIEDLMNSGVDIVISRALDAAAIGALDPAGQGGGRAVRHLRPRLERCAADRACRRRFARIRQRCWVRSS